jgi:hypothetical protein
MTVQGSEDTRLVLEKRTVDPKGDARFLDSYQLTGYLVRGTEYLSLQWNMCSIAGCERNRRMRTKPPLPMSGPSLNTGPSECSRTILVGGRVVSITVTVFRPPW